MKKNIDKNLDDEMVYLTKRRSSDDILSRESLERSILETKEHLDKLKEKKFKTQDVDEIKELNGVIAFVESFYNDIISSIKKKREDYSLAYRESVSNYNTLKSVYDKVNRFAPLPIIDEEDVKRLEAYKLKVEEAKKLVDWADNLIDVFENCAEESESEKE